MLGSAYRALFSTAMGLAVAAVPIASQATNGEISHGYSPKTSALAGSGLALPQDAMAAAINPAGMVFVDDRIDIGLSWFSPTREYTVTGAPSGGFPPLPGPTVESGSENFLVPFFGWKRSVGERGAFGISLYGNGGMNTDWKASDTPTLQTPIGALNGTFLAGNTGVNYWQLFSNFSYSRKFANDRAAWGIGGIVNYAKLKLNGLGNFANFSTDPAKLSNNGQDDAFGYGAIVSLQGNISEKVSLSAAYQTEVKNTFDDYSGLFAKGGDLNVPGWVAGGIAFKPNDRSAITFAVQHILYEDVDAIGNPGTGNPNGGLFACAGGDRSQCLGGSNGAGFGWEDMTIYKLGYQWQTGSDWTWRIGASTGDQPVPDNEVTLNIIAPGVVEEHFTFGFTKKLQNDREFTFGLMYAPEECIKGPSAFNPGQTVELCMEQFRVDAGFAF